MMAPKDVPCFYFMRMYLKHVFTRLCFLTMYYIMLNNLSLVNMSFDELAAIFCFWPVNVE